MSLLRKTSLDPESQTVQAITIMLMQCYIDAI